MASEKKRTIGITEKLAVAPTRGRVFKGTVVKKFPHRIVIEFERTVYVSKYERFTKKMTRLHARIPNGMKVEDGDYVKIRECRPLSKIVNFILIEVLKKSGGEEEK